MKNLLLSALISFTLVAQAKDLPQELADDGTVVGKGICTLNNKRYDCFKVLLKGEEFLVAGSVKEDGFYAQHVSKLVNKEYVVVWSWTPVKPKVTL